MNIRNIPDPSTLAISSDVVYYFHDYELDLGRRELRKRGLRMKVSPQTIRLLGYLIEHGGQLVTREQLFEFLWPGQSSSELEGNLNAAVRDAREVLGDTARDCRFIRTEPRRGYSFIHPYRRPANNDPSLTTEQTGGYRLESSKFGPRYAIWALGLLALVLAAIGSYKVLLPTSAVRPDISVVQLTNFTGHVGGATFSPDGRRLVFAWDGSDSHHLGIYVRDLNGTELTRLDYGDGDASAPKWSPDGQKIAFVKEFSNDRTEIRTVPATGGAEQQVTVVPNMTKLAWSADGQWIGYEVIFIDESVTPLRDCGVWAVSIIDGHRKQMTRLDETSLGDLSPGFSPDGRWLAFFRSVSSGVQDIYLQRLKNGLELEGSPERLTKEGQNSRDLTWTPDSKAIVFSSRRRGNSALYRVGIAPGQRTMVRLGGEDALEPVVNPKTNDVVYTRSTMTDRLRRVMLDGDGQPDTTFPIKQARNPALSPDGRTLAFECPEGGRIGLWLVNADGSGLRRLTQLNSALTGSPRWSPDGRSIAFDSRVSGRAKIYVTSAEGEGTRQITFGGADDILPSWSHDGQFVYFTSDRTGLYQIWRANVAGTAAEQITTKGGFRPLESLDGKTLFYAKGAMDTSIWAARIDRIASGLSDSEHRLVPRLSYWPNYAVSENALFLVPRQSQMRFTLERFDLTTNRQQTLQTAVTGYGVQGMAASQDGKMLYLSLRESMESNLMTLQLR